MVAEPLLVVFVDGLGYAKARRHDWLLDGVSGGFSPGYGYSSTIHPWLFAGLTPDDTGTFGEWNPAADFRQSGWPRAAEISGVLRERAPLVDRIGHRVIGHLRLSRCANIPFDQLGFFTSEGGLAYREQKLRFSLRHKLTPILAESHHARAPLRDHWALNAAEALVNAAEPRLFLSLVDIDALGHQLGPKSREMVRIENRLLTRLRRLTSRFRKWNQNGRVVLFSDHGMSPSEKSVRIRLRTNLGSRISRSLAWFVDSVSLRVWFRHPGLEDAVTEYLAGLGVGRILTVRERQHWALSDGRHGDLLFVLHEGNAFAPDFFGLRRYAGYHGYDPESRLQKAFLSVQGRCDDLEVPSSVHGFHRTLETVCRIGDGTTA